MEGLLILLLLVLIILVVSGNSQLKSELRSLNEEMRSMRGQWQQLVTQTELRREEFKEEVQPKPAVPEVKWAPKPIQPEETILKPPVKPELPPETKEALPEKKPAPAPLPVSTAPVVFPPPSSIPPPPVPPLPAKPGFFERNPDLEKFIGENLISKIGIAILVFAIGFFVKYSIDQGWIGPAGRVGIGVLCGGILIGVAHKMQRNYKAFSSVLVGGGLAVLYFSIALAYKDYHLFSQTVAFIIMVVITVFAILLSLLYDRQEVAIIALLGGFIVPFLVSNGSGNYVTLFSYLLLLNAGLLVIAYRKAWRILNLISFIATSILYIGWATMLDYGTPPATYNGGLAFATAFYLLFLAVNLAHNIRERKKFIASDFGVLLANNALYFTAGLYMLYGAHAAQYKGLFSAALGVLNLVLTMVLVRRQNIDKTILYLLVGVTLTFVSITAPLQLGGHYITLFWAAESVVLLWLLQKSGIRILQWGLLIVWSCTVISLVMDWNNVYGSLPDGQDFLPVMLNQAFITTLFVAASNALLTRLLRKAGTPTFDEYYTTVLNRLFANAALILLFAAGAFEIVYQFNTRYPDTSLSILYLQLYTGIFLLVLRLLIRKGQLQLPKLLGDLLSCGYLLFYLIASVVAYGVQEQMLFNGQYGWHFVSHWLSTLLTGILFYQLITDLRAREGADEFLPLISWAGSIFAVAFVSIELHLLFNSIAYDKSKGLDATSSDYIRVGLPIIWGLCSFAFMWLGMRYKYRPLRIVSLTLFTVTLLKLFLFDVGRLGAAGKIAAFFSLGVLLLVVSFMYQRLKRLIIEDERKDDAA